MRAVQCRLCVEKITTFSLRCVRRTKKGSRLYSTNIFFRSSRNKAVTVSTYTMCFVFSIVSMLPCILVNKGFQCTGVPKNTATKQRNSTLMQYAQRCKMKLNKTLSSRKSYLQLLKTLSVREIAVIQFTKTTSLKLNTPNQRLE